MLANIYANNGKFLYQATLYTKAGKAWAKKVRANSPREAATILGVTFDKLEVWNKRNKVYWPVKGVPSKEGGTSKAVKHALTYGEVA